MWTPTRRRRHSRPGLRYGNDLADDEWAIVRPLLAAEAPCGRKRAWIVFEVERDGFRVVRAPRVDHAEPIIRHRAR